MPATLTSVANGRAVASSPTVTLADTLVSLQVSCATLISWFRILLVRPGEHARRVCPTPRKTLTSHGSKKTGHPICARVFLSFSSSLVGVCVCFWQSICQVNSVNDRDVTVAWNPAVVVKAINRLRTLVVLCLRRCDVRFRCHHTPLLALLQSRKEVRCVQLRPSAGWCPMDGSVMNLTEHRRES